MAREDLTAAAQDLIGPDEIRAAGVFGLQDDYVAVTAGGVAAGAAMPDSLGPGGAGVAAAVGVEAGRQANAAAKGVTERMLVAVTDGAIHILAMTLVGGIPQRELMSFDRDRTQVEVKKFGLSRHLSLEDPNSGRSLALTGSTAPFSPEAKGDKAAISELGR
ncbi:MAG: hypothetical protein FJW90_12805 [Actinobacteria bacterium]|nr:hypothetical protein [Actinomycetota bacterium]